MVNPVLMLTSVFAYSINIVLTRCFQVWIQKSRRALQLYQALFSAAAALAYLVAGCCKGQGFHVQMLIPAALMGFFYGMALLYNARCYQLGFMSLSSVIVNLALLWPVAFSWFILKEKIYVTSVVGLAMIIFTLVLSSFSSKSQSQENYKRWICYVLIAFTGNGLAQITQKSYFVLHGRDNMMIFMWMVYGVMALVFSFVYWKNSGKEKEPVAQQVHGVKRFLAVSVASGLASFGGSGIMAYLCSVVNGGILYPCINGGVCIVTALASFLLFREPVFRTKAIALVIGVAAIVLLSI